MKHIWDEKKELNLQRERIRRTRQQSLAEVLSQSQPQPAGEDRLSPAVGRPRSIELEEIKRKHTADCDSDAPIRGVC